MEYIYRGACILIYDLRRLGLRRHIGIAIWVKSRLIIHGFSLRWVVSNTGTISTQKSHQTVRLGWT